MVQRVVLGSFLSPRPLSCKRKTIRLVKCSVHFFRGPWIRHCNRLQLINKPSVSKRYTDKKSARNNVWYVFLFYFIWWKFSWFRNCRVAQIFKIKNYHFLMCRWLHFLNSHFEKVHARGFATCRQLVATAQWGQTHSKFAFEFLFSWFNFVFFNLWWNLALL